MSKWTIAIVIELDEASSAEDAAAQGDTICNESSVEFTWLDTIVDPAENYMAPSIGEHT